MTALADAPPVALESLVDVPTKQPARHVAVVTTSYPEHLGDAQGHFIAAEVAALTRSGQRVTVICPRRPHTAPRAPAEHVAIAPFEAASIFGWPGALSRLKQNPLRALRLPQICQQARRILEATRPDEVHAHWLLPSLWPIAQSHSAPLTAVAHGSDVRLLLRLPKNVVCRLLRQSLDRDVRFRFVARHLLDDLLQIAGPLRHRLESHSFVAPTAVDTRGVPDKAQARRLLNLGDEFIAVSVGRLVSAKRIDVALAAPLPPGSRRIVIGGGPEHAALERAFPDARFLGHLDRPTTLLWLSAADLLVHASLHEGASCTIREARQLGTTVWTSAHGDVREWARGDPGIVVKRELG